MKQSVILLLTAAIAAAACSRGLNVLGLEEVDVDGGLSHGMIVLGDQLEDPYAVDNMTKALASVYPTKAGRVALAPTHYYVRFLPSGEEQFDRLEALCPHLLDHPVDYEILTEGDYYHDPDVPEEDITWQYAVVGKDFKFPGDIPYEILDSCYIPEAGTKSADGVDWSSVEREAYRLTGNEKMLETVSKGGGGSTPKGRITILDPDFSSEPVGLKGVKVSCNSFVKFSSCYTDEDGYYEMSRSFASDPRYRIVYKNEKGFGIGVNLIIVPASSSTLGKGSSSGMDVDITPASERKMFLRSAVNNAAYDYWQQCDSSEGMSISTPPSNLRIWLFHTLNRSSACMLQQGAFVDSSLLSDFIGEYLWIIKMFLPDLTIGVRDMDSYAQVYAATVHELAHASHYMKAGKGYWDKYIRFILKSFVTSGFVTYGAGTEADHGYCEVGEMWSYYMETMLYRERYGDNEKVFGTSYWFSPQILMHLDERGLNKYQLFQALSSDVTDKESLQNRILSLYPQMKATVNQAFGRYN